MGKKIQFEMFPSKMMTSAHPEINNHVSETMQCFMSAGKIFMIVRKWLQSWYGSIFGRSWWWNMKSLLDYWKPKVLPMFFFTEFFRNILLSTRIQCSGGSSSAAPHKPLGRGVCLLLGSRNLFCFRFVLCCALFIKALPITPASGPARDLNICHLIK